MEKQILVIQEFEDKTSANGKTYTRFKTDQGWMSCFNAELSNDIKKAIGSKVECDIAVKGNYKNITGCAANLENAQEPQFLAEPTGNKHTTMYVSYVKDLVVAGKAVDEAIVIIKKARGAFTD